MTDKERYEIIEKRNLQCNPDAEAYIVSDGISGKYRKIITIALDKRKFYCYDLFENRWLYVHGLDRDMVEYDNKRKHNFFVQHVPEQVIAHVNMIKKIKSLGGAVNQIYFLKSYDS